MLSYSCRHCGKQIDHNKLFKEHKIRFSIDPSTTLSEGRFNLLKLPRYHLQSLLVHYGHLILTFRNGNLLVLRGTDINTLNSIQLETSPIFSPVPFEKNLIVHSSSKIWMIDLLKLHTREVEFIKDEFSENNIIYPLLLVQSREKEIDEYIFLLVIYNKEKDISILQDFRIDADFTDPSWVTNTSRIKLRLNRIQEINGLISRPVIYEDSIFFFSKQNFYLINIHDWKLEEFCVNHELDLKRNVYKSNSLLFAYGKTGGIYKIYLDSSEGLFRIESISNFKSKNISFSVSNNQLVVAHENSIYVVDSNTSKIIGKHIDDTNYFNYDSEPKIYDKYIYYISKSQKKSDRLKIVDSKMPLQIIDKKNIIDATIDLGFLFLVWKDNGSQKLGIYDLN